MDTWLGKKNKIQAVTKEDYYLTINKKDLRNLKVILKYEGPIVAPVQKGEKIAELIVFNKDEKIKTLPLFAHEDLKKVNFFKSLITSINYFFGVMYKKRPFFIVFEGVEGCGKSFQSKNYLKNYRSINFRLC